MRKGRDGNEKKSAPWSQTGETHMHLIFERSQPSLAESNRPWCLLLLTKVGVQNGNPDLRVSRKVSSLPIINKDIEIAWYSTQ